MGNVVTDEELMLKYRDGDAGAFEELYGRYKGRLYRYLLGKCKSKEVAEDLYQEVWMKLINARGRYEVKAKFTTWLFQIANNHFIDYYRKHSGSIINCQGILGEIENIPEHEKHQPEYQVQIQQQTTLLMQFIGQLPDEQREAFLLREEAGMDIEEIAEVTGVNVETAKSRLRYAVNKLRKGLDKNG